MKLLVTGANGQLGRAAVVAVERAGHEPIGVGHAELPVEFRDRVEAVFAHHRPDGVLHCGAWTDVDGCERDPLRASRVNGAGTANVAEACARHGARMVYVSTDFVFDGSKREPYRVDDPTEPVSEYGRSKLAGELAVLEGGRDGFWVVRTSWVFGPGGSNFPSAILRRAREGGPLRVVDDQVGSPTMTHDLAEALVDLVASDADGGVYHASNEGTCSWHGFACEIVKRAGLDVVVDTMKSSELDRPAPRPAYSVLDTSRLTAVRGRPLPSYLDALDRYLEAEQS